MVTPIFSFSIIHRRINFRNRRSSFRNFKMRRRSFRKKRKSFIMRSFGRRRSFRKRRRRYFGSFKIECIHVANLQDALQAERDKRREHQPGTKFSSQLGVVTLASSIKRKW